MPYLEVEEEAEGEEALENKHGSGPGNALLQDQIPEDEGAELPDQLNDPNAVLLNAGDHDEDAALGLMEEQFLHNLEAVFQLDVHLPNGVLFDGPDDLEDPDEEFSDADELPAHDGLAYAPEGAPAEQPLLPSNPNPADELPAHDGLAYAPEGAPAEQPLLPSNPNPADGQPAHDGLAYAPEGVPAEQPLLPSGPACEVLPHLAANDDADATELVHAPASVSPSDIDEVPECSGASNVDNELPCSVAGQPSGGLEDGLSDVLGDEFLGGEGSSAAAAAQPGRPATTPGQVAGPGAAEPAPPQARPGVTKRACARAKRRVPRFSRAKPRLVTILHPVGEQVDGELAGRELVEDDISGPSVVVYDVAFYQRVELLQYRGEAFAWLLQKIVVILLIVAAFLATLGIYQYKKRV